MTALLEANDDAAGTQDDCSVPQSIPKSSQETYSFILTEN